MGGGSVTEWNFTMSDLPRMDDHQLRRARKLIRKLCCNYDHGNCIALDNGEPCICVQGISYSLLCKWFRHAILPTDRELQLEIQQEHPVKRCAVCGTPIFIASNRTKYCSLCAKMERRKKDAKRKRERYWNLRI